MNYLMDINHACNLQDLTLEPNLTSTPSTFSSRPEARATSHNTPSRRVLEYTLLAKVIHLPAQEHIGRAGIIRGQAVCPWVVGRVFRHTGTTWNDGLLMSLKLSPVSINQEDQEQVIRAN